MNCGKKVTNLFAAGAVAASGSPVVPCARVGPFAWMLGKSLFIPPGLCDTVCDGFRLNGRDVSVMFRKTILHDPHYFACKHSPW